MKFRSLMVATIVVASSLVIAQVCPPTTGSVCLVPSSSVQRSQATTYALPTTVATTAVTVPYSGTIGTMPMYSAISTCPTMSTMSAMPTYGYSAMAMPSTGFYAMTPTNQMTTTTVAAAPVCPMGTSMTSMPAYQAAIPAYSYQASVPTYSYQASVPTTYSYQAMAMPSYNMAGISPTVMTPIAGNQIAACPTTISPDTASIVNQVVGLRGDIRSLQGTFVANSLQMQGQDLVSRMNRLMASEMLFRQQIAANPNMPGAQAIAFGLSADADALNRDLASFNQELSMIPVDQRPYLAQTLNSFSVAYWDPTMQQFSMYRTQFSAQAPSAYQPAIAANPWLSTWQTGYQTSLNNIASVPQAYASANWWSTTRVLGSTEMYPSGTMMVPAGVVFVPAGSMGVCTPSTMSVMPMTPSAMGTTTTTTAMGATMPVTSTTTTTTATTTGTMGTTTPPPMAAETTTTPATETVQPGIGY